MTKFYGLSFFSYFFSAVVEAIEEIVVIVAILHVTLVVANLINNYYLLKRRGTLCQKIEDVDVTSDVEITAFG